MEGFLECADPNDHSRILGAGLGGNGHADISELTFTCQKQGIPCQALIIYWDGIKYFTRTDFIGRGVRVTSPEVFYNFLFVEEENLELRAFVEKFVRCYSNADAEGVDSMLVSSLVPVDPDTIPGHGYGFEIEILTGIHTAEEEYAVNGRALVAAAYSSYPDGYVYLNLELVKENGQWKVSAFWLDDSIK